MQQIRKQAGRLVFVFITGTLLVNFYLGNMVHQLHEPVLRFPYVDPTYWLLHYIHVLDFIAGNYPVACVFDGLLLLQALFIALFPAGRKRYAVFLVLYSLYFFMINSYGTHHAHPKIAILVMSSAFLFQVKHFHLAWEAVRYYIAFYFFCAFLWKLLRGSLFYPEQGQLIMKLNFTELLYYHPQHWMAKFYTFLLQHPLLITSLYVLGILLEGIFVAAFFTKKWDRFLFLTVLLLPFGFYLFADAYFFEMWIAALVFVPLSALAKPRMNFSKEWFAQKKSHR